MSYYTDPSGSFQVMLWVVMLLNGYRNFETKETD